MKTYKKRLKLKENVKLFMIWATCSIILVSVLTWYSTARLPNLEHNEQENNIRAVEVNFKK